MLTLAHVRAAHDVVQRTAWNTPLVPSPGLSSLASAKIHLKLECWQRTGSFKIRGALAKLDSLGAMDRARGIVTASAGNHGLGVAFAAQTLGIHQVHIFVPRLAPTSKVTRLSFYPCQIHRAGHDYDEAHAIAEEFAHERGAVYISAYDDPQVIAGQGTVGIEVLAALPEVDTFLIPVGGGGLIAGVTIVARTINPAVTIIGLQSEASPSAFESLREGRPYETYPAGPTICDGLAGGFGRVPFELAAHLIDQVVVVPETAIRQAVAWLLANEQLLVEGSGAIAVAPLLAGTLDLRGRTAVAILTGRNLDASVLSDLLNEWSQSDL